VLPVVVMLRCVVMTLECVRGPGRTSRVWRSRNRGQDACESMRLDAAHFAGTMPASIVATMARPPKLAWMPWPRASLISE